VPVGYLVSVALVTLFALVPLRAVGNLSFRLGLLLNEVPILGFYWLVADTSLAFAEGDISSAGGWATVGLAALTTAGLAVIAWRGLRARPVLEQAMAEALGADWRTAIDPGLAARLRRRLPVARILLLPLSRRGRGVERVANIRYGDAGRRNLLDLYRSRARPSGGPVLIHLHGGGYTRGRKNSQSLPLLYRLASQGWVSSPLAYARADAPPFFIAHGDHDTISPVEAVRHFADALGSVSANPVVFRASRRPARLRPVPFAPVRDGRRRRRSLHRLGTLAAAS
jgi:acetyl esterase/lipase